MIDNDEKPAPAYTTKADIEAMAEAIWKSRGNKPDNEWAEDVADYQADAQAAFDLFKQELLSDETRLSANRAIGDMLWKDEYFKLIKAIIKHLEGK